MTRITLPIALALVAALPLHAGAQTEEAPVAAPFLDIGWRVLGLADHVSHGPDFQVGVRLWDHLKIGVAGFARPGPINPRSFRHDLPAGETYRGQSSLDLRSDGSVVGLLVAPTFRVRRLNVEIPVLVGFGAFGFYLTGDDRETPDGDRVSTWENRLMDEADSGAGIALDVGIRLSIDTRLPYVRPFVGLHYTRLFGYDALLASSYDGFSGVVGVAFGR